MTFPILFNRCLVASALLVALMPSLSCEHSVSKPDPKIAQEKKLPSEADLCRMVFRRSMNLPLSSALSSLAKEGAALESELPKDSAYRALARCAVTLSECETLPAPLASEYDQALRGIRQDDALDSDTCSPLVYLRAQRTKSLADYDVLLQSNSDCERCFFEKSVLLSQQNQPLSDADLIRALAYKKHPLLLREHAIRRAREKDPETLALYEEYLALLPSGNVQERERTHRALTALYRDKNPQKYRQHLDAAIALNPDIELVRAQLKAAVTDDERFIFSQRLANFDAATHDEKREFAELAFGRGDAHIGILTLDRLLGREDLNDELRQTLTNTRRAYIGQTAGVRERPYQGAVEAIAKVLRKDIEPLVLALPPKGNQLTRARIDVVLELDASGTLTHLALVKDTLNAESIARAIRINLARAQMRSPGGTHRFALEFVYGKP